MALFTVVATAMSVAALHVVASAASGGGGGGGGGGPRHIGHPQHSAPSFCSETKDGWELVFSDEFNGTVLDTATWSVDLQGNDSRVRNSLGTADNVRHVASSLSLSLSV